MKTLAWISGFMVAMSITAYSYDEHGWAVLLLALGTVGAVGAAIIEEKL